MSFSLKVKDELVKVVPPARHCQIAELSAIVGMSGNIYTSQSGKHYIRITTENRDVACKSQLLIQKAFGYESDSSVRYNKDTKNTTYIVSVMDSDMAIKILLSTKLMNTDGSIKDDMSLVSTVGISNICCKRSFLRGAFLAGGSMSDPEKSYHFEIVSQSRDRAKQLMDILKCFELDARVGARRQYQVVYLKEGEQIVDVLNVMGAHVALMNLENVRVLKDVRNSVNRQVNCETANLNKTVSAAVKQIEDINYIRETVGLGSLSEGLEQIAELRLKYPDVPLKNLGEILTPPVGKSGVNHRLRKIGEIAQELRQNDISRGGKKND